MRRRISQKDAKHPSPTPSVPNLSTCPAFRNAGRISFASLRNFYCHEHRKEDHQAKKNHEGPAPVSPAFPLALLASISFLLFVELWSIDRAAVFVLPHHRWKQKYANDQGCKLSLTKMIDQEFHVSRFFKTAFASNISQLNSCISVF